MVRMLLVIALLIVANVASASPNLGPLVSTTNVFDSRTPTLIYDAVSGNLSFDGPPNTVTFEIKSKNSRFDMEAIDADRFTGLFDTFSESKLFRLDPGGMEMPIDFGDILPTALSETELLSDLVVEGTGNGPTYLLVVPEPAASPVAALFIGILFVARTRRTAAR